MSFALNSEMLPACDKAVRSKDLLWMIRGKLGQTVTGSVLAIDLTRASWSGCVEVREPRAKKPISHAHNNEIAETAKL